MIAMIKARLALVALLTTCGCSGLFGKQDVGPAVEAADALLKAHWSTAVGIRSILENPKVTMDPAVKAAIIAAVEADLDNATKAHDALVRALSTWGDVDWQSIYKRFKQAYDEIRSR